MGRRRTAALTLCALAASTLVGSSGAVPGQQGPVTAQSSSYAGGTERPRSPHRVLRKLRQPNAPATGSVVVSPVVAPPPEAEPVEALPTGPHSFIHVDAGAPTRWNPCQPVPWLFNPSGAPRGGFEAVQAAVATLADRTGLTFRYDGPSATVPSMTYLQQSWGSFRPLLVGWSSATESDLLVGAPASRVGTARILWTGSYDLQGRNHTQIASGVVAFNSAHVAGTTGPASWYTFALHELGHAVGLGHVTDDQQIMRGSIPSHLGTYGSGDLEGLRAVGSGSGCLPNIR